jgi:hypothetical protein
MVDFGRYPAELDRPVASAQPIKKTDPASEAGSRRFMFFGAIIGN